MSQSELAAIHVTHQAMAGLRCWSRLSDGSFDYRNERHVEGYVEIGPILCGTPPAGIKWIHTEHGRCECGAGVAL